MRVSGPSRRTRQATASVATPIRAPNRHADQALEAEPRPRLSRTPMRAASRTTAPGWPAVNPYTRPASSSDPISTRATAHSRPTRACLRIHSRRLVSRWVSWVEWSVMPSMLGDEPDRGHGPYGLFGPRPGQMIRCLATLPRAAYLADAPLTGVVEVLRAGPLELCPAPLL